MRRNSTSVHWRHPGAGLLVTLAVIAGAACVTPLSADQDGLLESMSTFTLDACIELVVESSPAVSAARHAWLSAGEAVGRAGSLPDPVLSYGYFVNEVETRVGPQVQRFALRQTLPWFGKLRLRSEAAEASADAAYQRYRRAAADAVFEVSEAYAEYANLKTTIGILERRASLYADLESVVRARYSSGEVPYADLMRAGIERARIADRLAAAVARRRSLSSRLSTALGLTHLELLPWPEGVPDVRALPQRGAPAELARVSPEVLLLDSRIEGAESLRSLARRGYFPDVTFGVDYIVTDEAAMPIDDSGKDPIAVSASVSIPLWFGKHAAEVAEQVQLVASARSMRQQKENEVATRLELALFDMDDAARRVTLYREEIVPLAEQSLASARAAYGGGAIGFDAVVSAEQALLESQLSLAQARVDAVVAGARFEQLLGSHIAAEQ